MLRNVTGLGQAVNGARSSEHWNVAPSTGAVEPSGGDAAKVKVASLLPVSGSGPVRIVVSGPASLVNRWTAGVGSTLSKLSMARISSTCSPPGRSISGRYQYG